MKSLLPWLCVLGLSAAVVFLYSGNQKKDAELQALRDDVQKLQQAQADLETNKPQASAEELARLRKENEDVLRLRNEVRQLRDDKQKLEKQYQTAQSQVQGAQAQAQTAQAQAAEAALRASAAKPQAVSPEVEAAFRARYGLAPISAEQGNLNACINNLRQIDGAKQQWALEHGKTAGALLTPADLQPYLKSNTLPSCPGGGVYNLNPVGIPPICSVPGHALPK
jgi:DNA repair exonuclease SbcCD ATPase subunit